MWYNNKKMNLLNKVTIIFGITLLLYWVSAFLFFQKDMKQQGVALRNSTIDTSTPALKERVPTLSPNTSVAPDKSNRKPAPDYSADLLKRMHITFSDEFDSFSRYVDKIGNTTCEAGGNGTWQTVYHFCSRTNPGNNEAEVYTDQTFLDYLNKNSISTTTARNPLTINNGILTIEATQSDNVILSAVGRWAKYTSGMITTQFSFSQTYGYFEIRAMLPSGRGLWPAFWLLPVDETWPPEVDAMEFFGDTSNDGQGGATKIHYASHTVPGQADKSCRGWYDVGIDISKAFHIYGVNVEPDGITYYFDGKSYATCVANPDTNKPFYMLVDLAVGGQGSWPGVPDASTKFPAYMYVDYIRAYSK